MYPYTRKEKKKGPQGGRMLTRERLSDFGAYPGSK